MILPDVRSIRRSALPYVVRPLPTVYNVPISLSKPPPRYWGMTSQEPVAYYAIAPSYVTSNGIIARLAIHPSTIFPRFHYHYNTANLLVYPPSTSSLYSHTLKSTCVYGKYRLLCNANDCIITFHYKYIRFVISFWSTVPDVYTGYIRFTNKIKIIHFNKNADNSTCLYIYI